MWDYVLQSFFSGRVYATAVKHISEHWRHRSVTILVFREGCMQHAMQAFMKFLPNEVTILVFREGRVQLRYPAGDP